MRQILYANVGEKEQMSCVLRATGTKVGVIALQKETPLQDMSFYIKGEPRFPSNPSGRKNEYSGFAVTVSEADFNDLKGQIKDTINYLKKNKMALAALRSKGFKDMRFDFGIEKRDVWAQFEYFPPEFLRLAGEIEIGLEISLYPVAEERAQKKKSAKKRAR